jgi:hypothetical protein
MTDDEPLALGRERQAYYSVAPWIGTLKPAQGFEGHRIPKIHLAATTNGGQEFAIGRECGASLPTILASRLSSDRFAAG